MFKTKKLELEPFSYHYVGGSFSIKFLKYAVMPLTWLDLQLQVMAKKVMVLQHLSVCLLY